MLLCLVPGSSRGPTWWWTGEHWVGRVLRKKARRKGLRMGGIQSVGTAPAGNEDGRGPCARGVVTGAPAHLQAGRFVGAWLPAGNLRSRRTERLGAGRVNFVAHQEGDDIRGIVGAGVCKRAQSDSTGWGG